MTKRRKVCLTVAAITAAALGVTSGFVDVWHPLESMQVEPGTLKGRLRTSAEHDRLYSGKPYVIKLTHGEGALWYGGGSHTKDPENAFVKLIQSEWVAFRPTVALVESRLGVFVGTLNSGVRVFGEPAAAYGMARNYGVPIFTLEPPQADERAALLRVASRERVAMFLALRTYLSDRRNGTVSDDDMAGILTKRQAQYAIEGAIPDVKSLDRLWQKDFPGTTNWREISETALYPRGATYLNELARAANEVRDQHFNHAIIQMVKRGERVFAVAGSSHVINNELILRAELEKVRSQ